MLVHAAVGLLLIGLSAGVPPSHAMYAENSVSLAAYPCDVRACMAMNSVATRDCLVRVDTHPPSVGICMSLTFSRSSDGGGAEPCLVQVDAQAPQVSVCEFELYDEDLVPPVPEFVATRDVPGSMPVVYFT